MNDEHDLDEVLRLHGGAPGHLPDFEARLMAGLDDADREMGRTGRHRLHPRRSRSLWARHPVLAMTAAAAVVAAVAAAFLVGLPGTRDLTGPPPVSAALIIQKALHAISSGRTLQADTTLRLAETTRADGTVLYRVTHYRLFASADGSFRLTQTDRPQTRTSVASRDRPDADDLAYDAATGVFRHYVRGWSPKAERRHGGYVDRLVIRSHYPLGPPDRWANLSTTYEFGAVALALQAADKALLETTTYRGRPAWVITPSSFPAHENVTARITVDQQTCLPVRFLLLANGVPQVDYSWKNVLVNEPLPPDAFTFAQPAGARVRRLDAGFRRLSPAEAARLPGIVPLLPGRLPQGYRAAAFATASSSTSANGVTKGSDVFEALYTRGFDTLTVSTRTVADPVAAARYDPVEPDTVWANIMRRDVRLSSGPFAGQTAALVVGSAISTPHLWVLKGDLLLAIAGSATTRELIAVAESLRPWGTD